MIMLATLAGLCCSAKGASPRVERLLGQMTLEEKAGQLCTYSRPAGSDYNPSRKEGWNATVANLRNGSIGSLYNGGGVKLNLELQRVAVEESRLGIPIIFGADVWHGMRTIFPIPLGEAASWNTTLAYHTARATAVEATASGLHWTYSPMVDVARDQRWGRVAEGAGEDPFLGAAFARARVQGFQGPDLAANDSLAACLKHYAGYGGVAAGLDYSAADMSEATFRDVFLPPFSAGVEAGALSLMSAFIAIIGGVPASGSRWLQTDVLRGELNFTGFVVSDYEANLELIDHGYAANESDAAAKALWAGVDMAIQDGLYYKYIPDLVRDGTVAEATLNLATRRVLSAKERMGLLDHPYRSLDLATEQANHYMPAHDVLSHEAAVQSIVMLKNEGGLLPLRKSGQKIAVIGWWANDRDNLEGCGVIWGNKTFGVTLAEGILSAVADVSTVRVVPGCGVETVTQRGLDAATAAAAWADVVVLAVGEPRNYTSEAQSRLQILVPSAQQRLAEAVAGTGTPMVVLLKNGRALVLEGAVKDAEAILVTWFLGKKTGSAIADILFGVQSPSGRLPVSFPLHAGQQPYHYNHMSSGRPCVGVGDPSSAGWTRRRAFKNCWRTEPNAALYPFGFGLTYSVVRYSAPAFSPASAELAWEGALNISAHITNEGSRAVEEVVQLYIHDRVASRVRPIRQLKGFRRVALGPHETRLIVFSLTRHDLGFAVASPHAADTQGSARVIEPGVFDVWVTSSATAGNASSFALMGP